MIDLTRFEYTLKCIRFSWMIISLLLLPYILMKTPPSVIGALEFLYFYLMVVAFVYAISYIEITVDEYRAIDTSSVSKRDFQYLRNEFIFTVSTFALSAGCIFLFFVAKLVSLIY